MKPNSLLAAITVYILYSVIIFSYWFYIGADYTNLSTSDRIFSNLVVPLGLGAIFLILSVSKLGWWRQVLSEQDRGHPHWTAWVVGLGMALFIGVNLITTDWSAIGSTHLVLLALAGLLVGFNEEVLYRGVTVCGFRQHGFGERAVWFLTCLLFALAHLPNGLFGTGLGGAMGQAVMVFFAASAYYLLRRVSGTLLVPIIFHGLWDFSIFAQDASGAPPAMLVRVVLDALVALTATGLMFLVLRARGKVTASHAVTGSSQN